MRFKDYVACKWPLHIYSVDPVLDQQNVLDAYSRRTELQLALAVAVATGQFNVKNANELRPPTRPRPPDRRAKSDLGRIRRRRDHLRLDVLPEGPDATAG